MYVCMYVQKTLNTQTTILYSRYIKNNCHLCLYLQGTFTGPIYIHIVKPHEMYQK